MKEIQLVTWSLEISSLFTNAFPFLPPCFLGARLLQKARFLRRFWEFKYKIPQSSSFHPVFPTLLSNQGAEPALSGTSCSHRSSLRIHKARMCWCQREGRWRYIGKCLNEIKKYYFLRTQKVAACRTRYPVNQIGHSSSAADRDGWPALVTTTPAA